MTTFKKSLEFKSLRKSSAWALLAYDLSPIALGLLSSHLGGNEKRLPATILHQRIEHDLNELRIRGFSLPQSAQLYLARWLKDGFLERDLPENAQEEEYELSVKSHQCLKFLEGLSDNKTLATESRLSNVIKLMSALAQQTDPNKENRIAALEQEKRKIDQEIERIRQGKSQQLDTTRSLERLKDIIYLSKDISDDFRLVKEKFRKLNVSFRREVLESEGSRGDILETLFAGVDLIANSEEGKSFRTFWRLLTDHEQSLEFETALDALLSRKFAGQLERQERLFLVRLGQQLLSSGQDVHDSLDGFSRNLKQFVQRRDFQQKKLLSNLIEQAQKQALNLKEATHAISDIDFEIDLTGSEIHSIAHQMLYDPNQELMDETNMSKRQGAISLAKIANMIDNSEIDLEELEDLIARALKNRGQLSISQLLDIYGAPHGLGTIVGYVAIGVKKGIPSQQKEKLSWKVDGNTYQATLKTFYFTQEQFL